MNVNPHLQYLQQQQQNQQPVNSSGQSPQISQLQLQQQQQLQQQRQQLLNHHLQQQQPQKPQQQQMSTPNASHIGVSNHHLAGVNGVNSQNSNNNASLNASGQSINSVVQLQMQQQLQQKHLQQFYQPQLQGQQGPLTQNSHQVPIIKEVWLHNLEQEFLTLRSFIEDHSSQIFITIHQEIPGIVARPVGTFKSSSDYHFQTLRSNSDLLNLIQLSFCITKFAKENEVSTSVIWQFNFLYDLTKEMYNEEHLNMLSQTSQINFQMHMTQGIPHFNFAELMIDSGLLLDKSFNWISYHAGYDLGFLVSLLINDSLPLEEKDFHWWCSKYFPNFYDLKLIGSQLINNNTNGGSKGLSGSLGNSVNNAVDIPTGGSSGTEASKNQASSNKPSIEYLAEELHLLPISPAIRQYFASNSSGYFPGQQQQQMSSTLHTYLSMECFKELFRQVGFDLKALDRYKGVIWGLGPINGEGHNDASAPPNGPSVVGNSTNQLTSSGKSGVVHFGRPF